jgi:hypothetical protein
VNKQKHIRGPQTNFTFSPRALNNLLLGNFEKHIGAWTNKNQEFSQYISRKQRGPQRNLVDESPRNIISPICFHLNRVGNVNDDTSSEEHFERSKSVEVLI